MLQALIITLREGVEAALIVGITIAYLTKIGRTELCKTVYAALGTALLGSVAGAVVLSRTGLDSDVFEGWVMLVAAVFVISMVIFMMRTARKLKGEIETKVGSLATGGSKWGLFAFVFLMVLREGVETVLILSAVSLNSSELMSFIGTLLGIGMAVLFGVMFVKGSVRINLGKFFRVTSVILIFVAIQLVITGLHELSENGLEIRFWLYRKPDGKVATVFDACTICGAVGFYKSSTGVVCKNCAAPVNPQSVGQEGGCNPIPLKTTVVADTVLISEGDVAAGSRYLQQ